MSIYQYIPFNSFHVKSQKLGWITAELERFWFLSTTYYKYLITTHLFFNRLKQRGYPTSIIHYIFEKFNKSHWTKDKNKINITKQQNNNKTTFYLKLEYNPTWINFKLHQIIPKDIPNGWNFQISWSNSSNLGKKLIKSKLNDKKLESNHNNMTKQLKNN